MTTAPLREATRALRAGFGSLTNMRPAPAAWQRARPARQSVQPLRSESTPGRFETATVDRRHCNRGRFDHSALLKRQGIRHFTVA